MAARLAVFNLDPRVALQGNVFGKDVANFRLFQALVRHAGLEQVDFLMTQVVPADQVAAKLVGDAPGAARITTNDMFTPAVPIAAGTLLRGSGKIEELAWLRRKYAGERGYSLIGVIHTLGPPASRHAHAMLSVAPVQPWDALVCTSPAVREVFVAMYGEWEGYLRERFGAARIPRPHLPVIPLGVDGAAMAVQADRPQAGRAARAALGVGADDILLLWVGRLSFFEKAFPQPMMRAAEEAARATGARVHFAMVGWFPDAATQEPLYRAAAAACAPSVGFHIVDGSDQAKVADMWAASDIFVSLVDNTQETFGLTPIEAMAAGLPVVVSDWDGYRSTVRDGEEGFLIPTLIGPSGGLPDVLLDSHALTLRSYQHYIAAISQHTAVHVGRAAGAIAALIRSPDLRRRMGDAGRRRVRAHFDWAVVAPRYAELAGELAAIRRSGAEAAARPARHPVTGDPFGTFAGFASHRLGLDVRLSLRPGAGAGDLERAAGVKLDMFADNLRLPHDQVRPVLATLAAGPATARALLEPFPVAQRRRALLSLLWLAKLGMIDWLE